MNERINAEIYSNQLERVKEAMAENRPHRSSKDVLFLHDNARPHASKVTKKKLRELGWEVLEHPPYSPDLAPSDYHLFRSLQHYLKGKQFRRMEEISENISAFFALKPTGFYVKGIARLQERWEKVVEYEGDYFVD